VAWENVFHGNASGVDTAASELGGCLSFRRGEVPQPLRLAGPIRLVIGLVQAGASTRRMVEQVAAQRAEAPARVTAVLEETGALVERAERALCAGELRELGTLMSRNHDLLGALGVSTPKLDRACQSAREHGALGAKLTGSGGGGCAVALLTAKAGNEVLDAWRRDGIACWEQRTE
jgi:mevalonate kinase